MIIKAHRQGMRLTAQQAIARMRAFLIGFEAVSPWERPFEAHGSHEKLGYLPIAADFSNFDEAVLRTLDNRETRFHNAHPPGFDAFLAQFGPLLPDEAYLILPPGAKGMAVAMITNPVFDKPEMRNGKRCCCEANSTLSSFSASH
jgi:hypothetical protein